MACEHDDRLLDLVAGELDGPTAKTLRAQVDACPHCGARFQELERTHRLVAQLPMVTPPADMMSSVLAAARQKVGAEGVVQARAAEPEPASVGPGWWAAVVAWVQGFAYGPQLAAAGVMLAVGMTVWVLPGEGGSEVDLATRTERLTADPETTAQVAPETERLEGDAPEVEPEVEPEVALDLPTETETEETGPVRTTRNATARIERGPEVQQPQQQRLQLETEVVTDPRVTQNAQAQSQMRAVARQQAQAEAAQVDVDGWRLGEQAESEPQVPAQNAENTLEPLENQGTEYEEAMNRYRGGQYVEAAAEFERVIGRPGVNRELLPSAQHHLARSHRQRGACAAAVNHYERLFQRYPAYGLLPQALIEAADCYRRVGRYSEARAHLHRAAGYNSTSAAARRELTRLDTIERAARRQNTINRAQRQSHDSPSAAETQEAY